MRHRAEKRLNRELTSDLPVMSERIHDAAQAPSVFFRNGLDLFRASFQRSSENCIGIWHGQNHANCAATQSLWAEITMLRRLVGQPEFRSVD